MSAHPSARPQAPQLAARLHNVVLVLARIPARFHTAAALSRSRKGLLALDDHLLRDIGLTPAQALFEANRPAWDAPEHWKG